MLRETSTVPSVVVFPDYAAFGCKMESLQKVKTLFDPRAGMREQDHQDISPAFLQSLLAKNKTED